MGLKRETLKFYHTDLVTNWMWGWGRDGEGEELLKITPQISSLGDNKKDFLFWMLKKFTKRLVAMVTQPCEYTFKSDF